MNWVEQQNDTSNVIKLDVCIQAEPNRWYRWAYFTARKHTDEECIVCAGHKPKLKIVPHPYKFSDCTIESRFVYPGEVLCPAWCLIARAAEIFVTGSREANRTKQTYLKFCDEVAGWPLTSANAAPPNGVIIDLGGKEMFECFEGVGDWINLGVFRG